ncbi:MAG: family 10 glycosylhydrolase, partial [Gemmatimonadota bacterium]|nr:family 10 glycosylhydrolase [Gemmatimonadota bacterium]
MWVASVANIDWPSRPGLSVAQQQAELLLILDRCAALRMNAVVLQVRPAADALYRSPHEPWSEYLTGEQGRDPGYDPLEFAIAEAHRRGLELHAWFNPYRARHPSARAPNAPGHVSRTRPEWVKSYGRNLWMDPGEPAVQDQTVRVILDVVRRYDVDGVHLDDYFYPYPENDPATRQPLPFPDSASYARYQAAGGRLGRDDWRRSNVDGLVQRLHREIRSAKPWVRFGISPFSIWRAGFPAGVRGFDPYEQLYADSRKWLVNGWVDYFAPQLYQPIGHTAQGYPT